MCTAMATDIWIVLILQCQGKTKAVISKKCQGTKKLKAQKKMPPAVDRKIYSTWLTACQRINAYPRRWTWTSAWRTECSRLLRLLSDNSWNTELRVTVLLPSQHSVHGEGLCPWVQVHISISALCACTQQWFIFLTNVFVQWIFIEYLPWDRHSVKTQ